MRSCKSSGNSKNRWNPQIREMKRQRSKVWRKIPSKRKRKENKDSNCLYKCKINKKISLKKSKFNLKKMLMRTLKNK